MRQLVSIETISDIQPIENADNIEVATVKGWKVVVKKDEFKVGDVAVYFEVDSWIHKDLAPFLKSNAKTTSFLGIEGALLKTVKLRGQISQGLLLPMSYVNDYMLARPDYLGEMSLEDRLGVVKFELPTKDNTGYQFPSFIPKTDQDRVQNLNLSEYQGFYEVTEKLDGSSMTVFYRQDDDNFGVCSRNIMFKDEVNNNFTYAEKTIKLLSKLKQSGLSLAIQGELVGPSIQGNPYKLTENKFRCYNVFDIDNQEYLLPESAQKFCRYNDIPYVPELCPVRLDSNAGFNIDSLLTFADGESYLNPSVKREGLVFKNINTRQSFKVISNAWLLKQK